MDQGWAALAAGAFGLVGAVVGGAAAVWGSKIGAEKTANATRQQVVDQARASHGQWLKQQRLEAVISFMATWDELVTAVGQLTFCITKEDMTSSEFKERYKECMRARRALEPCQHRVALLFNTSVPTDGIFESLRDAFEAAQSCHDFWGEAREMYRQVFARSVAEAFRNYNVFARVSSTVLVSYDLSDVNLSAHDEP
ncbi:hypothetical protein KBZ21_05290 [Streptomyces sp. A73]|nr:hypothetical protein [Streptomyces sp. A73]